ncbi:GtrA family protein [Ectobacillus panaciterrae]|uniref:GtrA family protein n=1 Tax=Ectobacillus panaciterrae TaxID=363872 RepID=UPI000491DFEA|nr:GtrA family protein [Ectobacillus panaciterrae]
MANKLLPFIKFGIVGILNTGIDIAIFTLLTYAGIPYLLAQCISYGSGVLNSYILNRSWTFQRKEKVNQREFLKFTGVNLITLGITSGLLIILYQHAGWPMLISKLCTTAIGVVVNFIGTRLWVFTEHPKERRDHI